MVLGDFGANLRLRRLGSGFLWSDSDDDEKTAISEQRLVWQNALQVYLPDIRRVEVGLFSLSFFSMLSADGIDLTTERIAWVLIESKSL